MSDLNGRLISKQWKVDGKSRACRGVIKYMGKNSEPFSYRITYEIDGDIETMERTEVEKYLLKERAATVKPAKKEKAKPAKKAKAAKKEVFDEEYWDATEAASCDGITIKKEWPIPGDKKGRTKFYLGKVTFAGDKERPYCFEVEYVDDKETMCLHEVLSLKKGKSATKSLAVKKTPMKKTAK